MARSVAEGFRAEAEEAAGAEVGDPTDTVARPPGTVHHCAIVRGAYPALELVVLVETARLNLSLHHHDANLPAASLAAVVRDHGFEKHGPSLTENLLVTRIQTGPYPGTLTSG